MKSVLIDCDPGLDDAVALLAAFGARSLNVKAITTVAGNVKGPQTAINARIIREAAGRGREIPVCAGAPRPLLRDAVTAEDFHGSTGLGNLPFPTPRLPLSRAHAVNMIIRACRAAVATPLTLIVTGPMTNIALALTMAPNITEGIEEIVVMAGADREGGNITPYAEFNVFADPHAAAIVFGAGVPMRCLSLDVTHQIRTTKSRLAQVREIETEQAKIAASLLDASNQLEFSANGARDAPLHDPSTVIAVTRPDLFSGRRVSVRVITEPGEQFGRTVPRAEKYGHIVWYERADSDAVYAVLGEHLGAYK